MTNGLTDLAMLATVAGATLPLVCLGPGGDFVQPYAANEAGGLELVDLVADEDALQIEIDGGSLSESLSIAGLVDGGVVIGAVRGVVSGASGEVGIHELSALAGGSLVTGASAGGVGTAAASASNGETVGVSPEVESVARQWGLEGLSNAGEIARQAVVLLRAEATLKGQAESIGSAVKAARGARSGWLRALMGVRVRSAGVGPDGHGGHGGQMGGGVERVSSAPAVAGGECLVSVSVDVENRSSLPETIREPDPEAVANPVTYPRLARSVWLFADDAGAGGPDRREQGHGLRARRSAHQKGRAGPRAQQGSLFVDR